MKIPKVMLNEVNSMLKQEFLSLENFGHAGKYVNLTIDAYVSHGHVDILVSIFPKDTHYPMDLFDGLTLYLRDSSKEEDVSAVIRDGQAFFSQVNAQGFFLILH